MVKKEYFMFRAVEESTNVVGPKILIFEVDADGVSNGKKVESYKDLCCHALGKLYNYMNAEKGLHAADRFITGGRSYFAGLDILMDIRKIMFIN